MSGALSMCEGSVYDSSCCFDADHVVSACALGTGFGAVDEVAVW